MTVYHSSPEIVRLPDTVHSRANLDFGRGFYVTILKDQAIKYAQRFLLRGQMAYLNAYEFDDAGLSSFKVLEFDSYDGAWLDYVSQCRLDRDTSDYDIVIGGIANDKVFRTIDLYFSGDISKEDALKRLKYECPNHQMCLRSQSIIDKCLTFRTVESIQND